MGPKTLANPKPAGVGKRGVQGAQAPWRGVVGGVPPRNPKRGRVASINKPATSGTQNAGKPKAYEGGQTGVQGAQAPMAGGCGGASPHETKRGGELPSLTSQPRVGPKTLANPWPTGVGKRGVQGGEAPHGGGLWGVSPHKTKRGGELPPLTSQPRVGPKRWQTLGQRGWENGGPGGRKPPWQGVWGCPPPQIQKRERVALISNSTTSGTQNAGKP